MKFDLYHEDYYYIKLDGNIKKIIINDEAFLSSNNEIDFNEELNDISLLLDDYEQATQIILQNIYSCGNSQSNIQKYIILFCTIYEYYYNDLVSILDTNQDDDFSKYFTKILKAKSIFGSKEYFMFCLAILKIEATKKSPNQEFIQNIIQIIIDLPQHSKFWKSWVCFNEVNYINSIVAPYLKPSQCNWYKMVKEFNSLKKKDYDYDVQKVRGFLNSQIEENINYKKIFNDYNENQLKSIKDLYRDRRNSNFVYINKSLEHFQKEREEILNKTYSEKHLKLCDLSSLAFDAFNHNQYNFATELVEYILANECVNDEYTLGSIYCLKNIVALDNNENLKSIYFDTILQFSDNSDLITRIRNCVKILEIDNSLFTILKPKFEIILNQLSNNIEIRQYSRDIAIFFNILANIEEIEVLNRCLIVFKDYLTEIFENCDFNNKLMLDVVITFWENTTIDNSSKASILLKVVPNLKEKRQLNYFNKLHSFLNNNQEINIDLWTLNIYVRSMCYNIISNDYFVNKLFYSKTIEDTIDKYSLNDIEKVRNLIVVLNLYVELEMYDHFIILFEKSTELTKNTEYEQMLLAHEYLNDFIKVIAFKYLESSNQFLFEILNKMIDISIFNYDEITNIFTSIFKSKNFTNLKITNFIFLIIEKKLPIKILNYVLGPLVFNNKD